MAALVRRPSAKSNQVELRKPIPSAGSRHRRAHHVGEPHGRCRGLSRACASAICRMDALLLCGCLRPEDVRNSSCLWFWVPSPPVHQATGTRSDVVDLERVAGLRAPSAADAHVGSRTFVILCPIRCPLRTQMRASSIASAGSLTRTPHRAPEPMLTGLLPTSYSQADVGAAAEISVPITCRWIPNNLAAGSSSTTFGTNVT